MDIKSFVYEITSIDKELKRMRGKMRELEKKRGALFDKTIALMKERGETQITINGQQYTLEERVVHSRKADKKKKQDAMTLLQEQGIQRYDAEELYSKLDKALKGQEKVTLRLKK